MATRGISDKTSLIGGIFIRLNTFNILIKQVCDPWRFFLTFGFTNVLTLLLQIEASISADSSQNLLRESLLNVPGVGPSSRRSSVESQVVTNNLTASVTQDAVRERDRFQIAITPLIWIACAVFAFTQEWRGKFTSKAYAYGYVPTIFVEFFKRTRHSSNGIFMFFTDIVKGSFIILVSTNPSLKNTFWDPDFLCSETGLQMFFVFLDSIRLSPGNYIPFTTLSPGDKNLPEIQSNQFTTFGAYSVNNDNDYLLTSIYTVDNALNIIKAVFLGDATLLHATYVDYKSNNPYIAHEALNLSSEIQSSTRGWCVYLVSRVCGLETNSVEAALAASPPSPERDTKQTSSRPKAPKGGFGDEPKFKRGRGKNSQSDFVPTKSDKSQGANEASLVKNEDLTSLFKQFISWYDTHRQPARRYALT